jgi:gliding motility-associated transport system permease protein
MEMSNTIAIVKKEFRSYFNTPLAYVFLVAFLVITQWLVMRGYFFSEQADLRSFFGLLPIIFILFVPAITMRLWAEERKQGTIETLMTAPVRDMDVILGKFLGAWFFLSLALLLTFALPLIVKITVATEVGIDRGPIIGGYIGLFLLGGAYLAIGLFSSSLWDSQIAAWIFGSSICFFLYMIGDPFGLFSLPKALVPFFQYLSLSRHFENISRGLIDITDIVYYFSVIFFFLFLNSAVLKNRK